MCSAPSAPAPQQVTPAPAPAPAAPAPQPVEIGLQRQDQNVAASGTISGPSTRVDRGAGSTGAATPGSGSGLNM